MKKVVIFGLILAICLSLCACGKTGTGWKIDYAKDEFGDPTENKVLTYSFEGTYSNSEETDAKLTGTVEYDVYTNNFTIELYKNKDQKVFFETNSVEISLKTEKETIEADAETDGSTIFVADSNIGTFLAEGLNVSVLIDSENPREKYKFELKATGFNDNVLELKKFKYAEAEDLVKVGKYDEAMLIFEILDSYENSQEMVLECKYCIALSLIEKQDYASARKEFMLLGDYKDSKKYLERFVSVPLKAVNMVGSWKFSTDEFHYDEVGNLIKEEKDNGSLDIDTIDYTYDSEGYLIKKAESDSITLYSYNNEGKLAKKVKTDDDGSETIYEFVYDNEGRRISAVVTDQDGSKGTYEYTYDGAGRLSKEIYSKDNTEIVGTYVYDNGKLIKSDVALAGSLTYEYTYDSEGNLIEQSIGSGLMVTTYSDYMVYYNPDKPIFNITVKQNGGIDPF